MDKGQKVLFAMYKGTLFDEVKVSAEDLALAKAEGIELTDEQLEAVSGGSCITGGRCPQCNSDQVEIYEWDKYENYEYKGVWQNKKCKSCGYKWDYEPA